MSNTAASVGKKILKNEETLYEIVDDSNTDSYSEAEENSQSNYDVKLYNQAHVGIEDCLNNYDNDKIHKNIYNTKTSKVKTGGDRNNVDDDNGQKKRVSCESLQSTRTKSSAVTRKAVSVRKPFDEYKCHICEHISKKRLDHNEHIATHRISTNPNVYKCDLCDHTSTRIWNMSAHLLTHKDPSEVTWQQCKFCDFKTKFQGSFKLHTRRHLLQKNDKLKCDECSYETASSYMMKRHQMTHKACSEEKRYKCTYCSNTYLTRAILRQHLAMHSGSSEVSLLRCDKCDFTTSYKYKLQRHQKTHLSTQEVGKTSDQPDQCQESAKMESVMVSAGDKEQDIQIIGIKIEPEYENYKELGDRSENALDVDCVQTYLSYQPQENYKMESLDNKILPCKNEEQDIEIEDVVKIEPGYNNVWDLVDQLENISDVDCIKKDDTSVPSTHLNKFDEIEQNETNKCMLGDIAIQSTIKCSVSERKCESPNDYKTHRTLLDPTWHSCDICLFKSKDSDSMRHHMASHFSQEKRSYKCKECAYETTVPNRLRRHKTIHKNLTDRKPYECVYCPNSYLTHAELKDHLMKHNDHSAVVLLRCDQCEYSTRNRSSYRKHVLKHTDALEDEIACDSCDYRTFSESCLKAHNKKCVKKLIISESKSSENCSETNIGDQSQEYDKMESVTQSETTLCNKEEEDIEIKNIVKIEPRYDLELNGNSENISDLASNQDDLNLPSTRQSQSDEIETNIIKDVQGTVDTDEVCENCGVYNIKECCVCGFETHCKCKFRKHIYTHKNVLNPPDMYKCTLCDQKFKYSRDFKTHVSNHKKVEGIVECPMCNRKCKTGDQYKNHILAHTVSSNPVKYQCIFCDYKATKMWNMKCHMLCHKNSSEVTLHKCDICNFTSKHKTSVRKHTRRHFFQENRNYKCDECSYETTLASTLKQHKVIHKKPWERKRFKCTHCSNSYARYYSLKEHLKLHQGPFEKQLLRCDRCDYTTINKSSYSNHIKRHKVTLNGEIRCDLCDYKSFTQSDLRLHFRSFIKRIEITTTESKSVEICSEISGNNEKPQEDEKMELVIESETPPSKHDEQDIVIIQPENDNDLEVDDQFENVSDLPPTHRSDEIEANGKLIQDTNKAKICENCGDPFSKKCYMCSFKSQCRCGYENHISMHKDRNHPDMYKCILCDNIFKYLRELRTHMLDHEATGPFKCPVCECECGTRNDYKNHVLTHRVASDPNIYQCVYCHHTVSRIWDMRTHLLIHKDPSEIIWYRCDMCSFKSKYRVSLSKHIATHSLPERKSYKCDECSYKTVKLSRMKRHKMTHKKPSVMKRYKCIHCSKSYVTFDCLKLHMKLHKIPSKRVLLRRAHSKYGTVYKTLRRHTIAKKKKFSCDLCNYRTSSKVAFTSHVNRCIAGKVIHSKNSEVCTKTSENVFSSTRSLENETGAIEQDILYPAPDNNSQLEEKHVVAHRNSLHPDMYECNTCSYTAKTVDSLKVHSLTHKSRLKTFQCPICEQECKLLNDYRKHIATHKVSSNPATYQCIQCDYKASFLVRLEEHMSVHRNSITLFECCLCGFKCKYSNDLGRHVLAHKDPTDFSCFKCSQCEFKSRYLGNFQLHLMSHKSTLQTEQESNPCQLIPVEVDINLLKQKYKERSDKVSSEINKHKCEHCNYETMHETDLTNHKLTHRADPEKRLFKCTLCSKTYTAKASLDYHMVGHQNLSEATLFRCDQCEYVTIQIKCFVNHKKNHDNQFNSIEDDIKLLMAKYKDRSNGNLFQCLYCDYTSDRFLDLKPHLLSHKDASTYWYKCKQCNYKTKYKSNLYEHALKHYPITKKYKCEECLFSTDYPMCLKRHELTHIPVSERPKFTCTYCPKSFITKANLKYHILQHQDRSKVTLYRCDECNYVSMQKRLLRNHHQRIHARNTVTVKMLMCQLCDIPFANEQVFKTHVKSCTKNKPVFEMVEDGSSTDHDCLLISINEDIKLLKEKYKDCSLGNLFKCLHCDYKTNRFWDLKPHLLSHKDPSKINCHECEQRNIKPKVVLYQQTLESIPTDNKLYKCDECSFSSNFNFKLNRHKRTHKPDREMFKCTLCSKTYTAKYSLKSHMKRHQDPSETTLFSCDECEYVTLRKETLKLHKNSHIRKAKMKMLICQVCDTRCANEQVLKTHVKKCMEERHAFDIVKM